MAHGRRAGVFSDICGTQALDVNSGPGPPLRRQTRLLRT